MSKPDKNLYSLANYHPLNTVDVPDLVATPEFADALKITNSTDGTVIAGYIRGGYEDCVDINNHCEHINVTAELFEAQGSYIFTVKGGSRWITLTGRVRGHGKVVDVDLGNIADQSDDLTEYVVLNLVHEKGDPISVRILGAADPIYFNRERQEYVVKFAIWKPFRRPFLKVYKQLKKILPI
jgi:hypothetical protein